ncbi:SUZ domain-containing protein [Rhodotorula toruloides]|uniref:SUZ domain-containing protein n=1 Tax=Rhodotorula toruloides TaxID=5286 RepID=A0A2T0A0Q9_RHOTO|nr:SUZ domain-containing protein [Rhodotorula toruloides]PRQ71582.1 hypothetical protein AAT19DRAFT_9697 [Rhodotorula toruloides]
MPLPPSAYSAFPEQRSTAPPDAWDDWEEDYSRDEQPTTEQAKNARLWQDANIVRPTYSILPSPSSRTPPSAALDASTANGPPQLKILKRPSPAPNASASSSSRTSSSEGRARQEKSLAEREKEYAEARRRILGEEAGAVKPSSSPSRRNGSVKGVREGMEKLSLQGGAKRNSSPGQDVRQTGTPTSSANNARRERPSTTSPASTPRTSSQLSRPPSTNGASAVRVPKGPSDRGFGFAEAATPNGEKSKRRNEVR